MAGSSLDQKESDHDIFVEKNLVAERVTDLPSSDVDHEIVKDWDGEEAAVRRK